MTSRRSLHLLALVILVLAIGSCFTQKPGFGDDLTYWTYGWDLHERGLEAWQKGSFHFLRWPVWGVCWTLQAIFGYSIVSYTGVGVLYLAAGSALAWTFGSMAFRSLGAAWLCGMLYAFHPLLDSITYRPMPDISEGVWCGLAMLCWWRMMLASGRGSSTLWAALTGLAVFLAVTNRLTGVFIAPILGAATLLYFPRRFGWLLVAAAASLVLYSAECVFYQGLLGDGLNSLHANQRARGVPGTEAVAWWYLPIRFHEALWESGILSPWYCVIAVGGIWAAWTGRLRPVGTGTPADTKLPSQEWVLARVLIIWLLGLYLLYACAPQSFSPWRPVVRNGARFLGSLALPWSILVAAGLLALWRLPRWSYWPGTRWLRGRGVLAGAVVVLLAAVASFISRPRATTGFLAPLREHVGKVPPGTKIVTNHGVRALAFMAHSQAARRLEWMVPSVLMQQTPELEATFARADEFWYSRTYAWRPMRHLLDRQGRTSLPPLTTAFDHPERDWLLTGVLEKDQTPEIVLHRRRTPGTPPPTMLTSSSPELAGLIPTLPFERQRQEKQNRSVKATWPIPPALRGRLCHLQIVGSAERSEPFVVELHFFAGEKELAEWELKPCLAATSSKDFFAVPLPANADRCDIRVKFDRKVEKVRIEEFRMIVEG